MGGNNSHDVPEVENVNQVVQSLQDEQAEKTPVTKEPTQRKKAKRRSVSRKSATRQKEKISKAKRECVDETIHAEASISKEPESQTGAKALTARMGSTSIQSWNGNAVASNIVLHHQSKSFPNNTYSTVGLTYTPTAISVGESYIQRAFKDTDAQNNNADFTFVPEYLRDGIPSKGSVNANQQVSFHRHPLPVGKFSHADKCSPATLTASDDAARGIRNLEMKQEKPTRDTDGLPVQAVKKTGPMNGDETFDKNSYCNVQNSVSKLVKSQDGMKTTNSETNKMAKASVVRANVDAANSKHVRLKNVPEKCYNNESKSGQVKKNTSMKNLNRNSLRDVNRPVESRVTTVAACDSKTKQMEQGKGIIANTRTAYKTKVSVSEAYPRNAGRNLDHDADVQRSLTCKDLDNLSTCRRNELGEYTFIEGKVPNGAEKGMMNLESSESNVGNSLYLDSSCGNVFRSGKVKVRQKSRCNDVPSENNYILHNNVKQRSRLTSNSKRSKSARKSRGREESSSKALNGDSSGIEVGRKRAQKDVRVPLDDSSRVKNKINVTHSTEENTTAEATVKRPSTNPTTCLKNTNHALGDRETPGDTRRGRSRRRVDGKESMCRKNYISAKEIKFSDSDAQSLYKTDTTASPTSMKNQPCQQSASSMKSLPSEQHQTTEQTSNCVQSTIGSSCNNFRPNKNNFHGLGNNVTTFACYNVAVHCPKTYATNSSNQKPVQETHVAHRNSSAHQEGLPTTTSGNAEIHRSKSRKTDASIKNVSLLKSRVTIGDSKSITKTCESQAKREGSQGRNCVRDSITNTCVTKVCNDESSIRTRCQEASAVKQESKGLENEADARHCHRESKVKITDLKSNTKKESRSNMTRESRHGVSSTQHCTQKPSSPKRFVQNLRSDINSTNCVQCTSSKQIQLTNDAQTRPTVGKAQEASQLETIGVSEGCSDVRVPSPKMSSTFQRPRSVTPRKVTAKVLSHSGNKDTDQIAHDHDDIAVVCQTKVFSSNHSGHDICDTMGKKVNRIVEGVHDNGGNSTDYKQSIATPCTNSQNVPSGFDTKNHDISCRCAYHQDQTQHKQQQKQQHQQQQQQQLVQQQKQQQHQQLVQQQQQQQQQMMQQQKQEQQQQRQQQQQAAYAAWYAEYLKNRSAGQPGTSAQPCQNNCLSQSAASRQSATSNADSTPTKTEREPQKPARRQSASPKRSHKPESAPLTGTLSQPPCGDNCRADQTSPRCPHCSPRFPCCAGKSPCRYSAAGQQSSPSSIKGGHPQPQASTSTSSFGSHKVKSVGKLVKMFEKRTYVYRPWSGGYQWVDTAHLPPSENDSSYDVKPASHFDQPHPSGLRTKPRNIYNVNPPPCFKRYEYDGEPGQACHVDLRCKASAAKKPSSADRCRRCTPKRHPSLQSRDAVSPLGRQDSRSVSPSPVRQPRRPREHTPSCSCPQCGQNVRPIVPRPQQHAGDRRAVCEKSLTSNGERVSRRGASRCKNADMRMQTVSHVTQQQPPVDIWSGGCSKRSCSTGSRHSRVEAPRCKNSRQVAMSGTEKQHRPQKGLAWGEGCTRRTNSVCSHHSYGSRCKNIDPQAPLVVLNQQHQPKQQCRKLMRQQYQRQPLGQRAAISNTSCRSLTPSCQDAAQKPLKSILKKMTKLEPLQTLERCQCYQSRGRKPYCRSIPDNAYHST